MPEYKPELYKPVISETMQIALWYLGIGIFCGFVFGFTLGVILS